MLGKLMRRRQTTSRGRDKAIVHQSVPEEVLYPNGRDTRIEDNDWLNTVSVSNSGDSKPSPSKPAAANAKPATSQSPAAKMAPETPPATPPTPAPARAIPIGEETFASSANQKAEGRPRYPHGWLVVVEGPGIGEWFPLERGVSQIGSGPGQTVQLDFGDEKVLQDGHASLGYDTSSHAFALEAVGDAPVRLNGIPVQTRSALRDGDVIALGGTSLRLVALCSPNFHWSPQLTGN